MKPAALISALALAFGATLSTVAHTAIIQIQFPLAPEAAGATGSGLAKIDYDTAAHTFAFDVTFSGLSGVTSVAHIHCCTAAAGTGTVAVAVTPGTLPGFPVGISSGNYVGVVDLTSTSSYTSGFLGGLTAAEAEAKLITGINAGKAYLNIHTTPTFTGGEIRGFLPPVPEPETYALMLAGIGLVGWVAARRRKVGV